MSCVPASDYAIKVDEDGISCKELYDTLSVGMVFYTFGILCDVLTILLIIDQFILSMANNLMTILRDWQKFDENVWILVDIKKNVTLCLISMCSTMVFRLLSFLTGLESTLYPLGYTVNILAVYLMLRFNEGSYNRCCGQKERWCFDFAFRVSQCCCRYQYSSVDDDGLRRISTEIIDERLSEYRKQKDEREFELIINANAII